MNENSKVIIHLCSYLCKNEEIKPLEAKEWTELANILIRENIQPSQLLSFTKDDFKSKLGYGNVQIERVNRLLNRGRNFSYEIEKYANMGIYIMTRADEIYPKKLKKLIGRSCPPLFYYCGNPKLLTEKYVGFVGSRSIDEDAQAATELFVNKVNELGYGVVSGGAKGVDTVAVTTSLQNNHQCIEYITDSLRRKTLNKETALHIKKDKLLLMSIAKPESGFETFFAMARNKVIYAQAEATIIIKSDLKKGGTWSGATKNLQKKFCPAYCWKNEEYEGNMALIESGVLPIDESWDGEFADYPVEIEKQDDRPKQMTIFDI